MKSFAKKAIRSSTCSKDNKKSDTKTEEYENKKGDLWK